MYGHRLVGVLVARQPDEAHLRLGHQRLRGVDHPEPGAQHGHQQRRVGEPVARWCARPACAAARWPRGVPGGLVDQHQGEVAQCGAERRVVGARVAHGRQPRLGQRVVDDPHVHGPEVSA